MKHLGRFIYNIKHFVNLAMSEPGLEPVSIAKKITVSLTHEKNSNIEEKEFLQFLAERRIKYLVHFTPIENVKNILQFGLIPRVYLKEEVIRIALNPAFSDELRLDAMEDANCLSITFPNHGMFYKKRMTSSREWAVLLIDPMILVKHKCKFSPDNNASSSVGSGSGIDSARRMFINCPVRKLNNLPPCYTTNPQAEVLEYSVISSENIKAINLISEKHLYDVLRLAKFYDIEVKVNRRLFQARSDGKYWKSHPRLDILDDYLEVLLLDENYSVNGEKVTCGD